MFSRAAGNDACVSRGAPGSRIDLPRRSGRPPRELFRTTGSAGRTKKGPGRAPEPSGRLPGVLFCAKSTAFRTKERSGGSGVRLGNDPERLGRGLHRHFVRPELFFVRPEPSGALPRRREVVASAFLCEFRDSSYEKIAWAGFSHERERSRNGRPRGCGERHEPPRGAGSYPPSPSSSIDWTSRIRSAISLSSSTERIAARRSRRSEGTSPKRWPSRRSTVRRRRSAPS